MMPQPPRPSSRMIGALRAAALPPPALGEVGGGAVEAPSDRTELAVRALHNAFELATEPR